MMSNGAITNFTTEGLIRLDLSVGIAYDADIGKAKEVLLAVLNEHSLILKDPAPFVGVEALADSSVNLAVRPYCKPEHYWDVFFDVNEQMKIALDKNKISIPFPQRDVHIFNASV